jgi:F-type H+-transporting ATPase subunit alpha
LTKIPVNKVRAFETEYLDFLDAKHRDILDQIKAGKIDDSITSVLEQVAKELTAKY